MSVVYCEYCDKPIDTDYDAEHFDFIGDGRCIEEVANSEEEGIDV